MKRSSSRLTFACATENSWPRPPVRASSGAGAAVGVIEINSHESTYDAGSSVAGAPFTCIEDAVPEAGSQCLPGRMYSTPQPMGERQAWPDQPEQFLPPHQPPEQELPLPDLMQWGASTVTDWLFVLLAVALLVVGYALLRVRRARLEAAPETEPSAPRNADH